MPSLILFNKPYHVVCQFSGDEHDKTLADYLPFPHFYPAGRLDKNSEGLLLLTDDGAFQHQLSHPRYGKRKHYWVEVEGCPAPTDLLPLIKGLVLNKETFKPAEVSIITAPAVWPRIPPVRFRAAIPTTWLNIILQEGKNHQVRKMTAAIGFPTLRLIRHQIAQWKLGDLLPGEYLLL